MLQFIRSKSGSFVVRLMFVALIGSFGIWGIGDFLRQTPSNVTALTVGGTKISATEVETAIERESESMKRTFGGTLSRDQLKQLGVVDRAVQGLTDRALFDEEAKRLHLAVGDAEIAVTIARDPAFQAANGAFNRDTFTQLLAANHISEADYVATLRIGIPRQNLAQVALANGTAPAVLVDWLYRGRQEKRVAAYIFLPADSVGAIAPPDDATLRDYYTKNPTAFTAPEYRGFTALALSTADVSVSVPESKLDDLYQQHLDEFSISEQRDVENLSLADAATAKAAAAALAGGQDFLAVAKQFGHQSTDTVELGWVERKDLPDAIADAAFGAKQDVATQPIKTDFGWSIVRVTGIKPPHVMTFQEAKPQLEIEARQDAAADALYALSNKVEDAIAGGADLRGIAQQFALKPFRVAAVDRNGLDPAGKAVAGLPVDTADLVQAAFATHAGQMSDLGQTKDGKFFIVHVDGVTPPALRPFAAVRDQVQAAWSNTQRATRLNALADQLTAQAKAGATLAALAAPYHAPIETTPPFARDADQTSSTLPASLVTEIFTVKPGATVSATGQSGGTDGLFVARLISITPGNPKTDPDGVSELSQEISSSLGNELVAEFAQALRRRYPVEVNQTLLNRLY